MIIVNSNNLDLIDISLRLIKMTINRLVCGLYENDDFREINTFLSKIPLNIFFNYLLFSECLPNSLVDLSNFQYKSTELLETQNYAYWYARFFPGTHDWR